MSPKMSPSSRRAWIEISVRAGHSPECRVALLAEGVDRNLRGLVLFGLILVALLAEGVDRNSVRSTLALNSASVALLAEGVDRNSGTGKSGELHYVALLAEGVDRNWERHF